MAGFDYKLLLMKYMVHVAKQEGTDFLGEEDQSLIFTDNEWAELIAISDESLGRSKELSERDSEIS